MKTYIIMSICYLIIVFGMFTMEKPKLDSISSTVSEQETADNLGMDLAEIASIIRGE